MNLGWTEMLLIGGILLLLFGPSKLPSLGKSIGEAIRGFKKGLNDVESEANTPSKSDDPMRVSGGKSEDFDAQRSSADEKRKSGVTDSNNKS